MAEYQRDSSIYFVKLEQVAVLPCLLYHSLAKGSKYGSEVVLQPLDYQKSEPALFIKDAKHDRRELVSYGNKIFTNRDDKVRYGRFPGSSSPVSRTPEPLIFKGTFLLYYYRTITVLLPRFWRLPSGGLFCILAAVFLAFFSQFSYAVDRCRLLSG